MVISYIMAIQLKQYDVIAVGSTQYTVSTTFPNGFPVKSVDIYFEDGTIWANTPPTKRFQYIGDARVTPQTANSPST